MTSKRTPRPATPHNPAPEYPAELQSQLALREAQLRQAEFKIERLQEQLIQGERLKKEFMSNMSHELRTPLNVVLGFGSLLADEAFGPLTEQQLEACSKIVTSSENLARLINDLLDFSSLRSETLVLHFAPLDVAAVTEEVVTRMRPLADAKRLTLDIELAERLPTLQADPERIKQAITHLLDNALKFTPDGGQVGIRIETLPDAEAVAIEVWDTGIGIPQEALSRLFESFYQVDGSSTRLHGGTGIGLPLVRELVERHGGEVTVKSRVGEGSTFTIVLPVSVGAVAR